MGFWVSLLISLAFTIVGELLRPKPRMDRPKPTSLGDYRTPTADETRPIPVAYGTVKITGPNAVWWGDFEPRAITKKVKTGLFSSDRITLGYQYWLGMQLALCWGQVDELIGLEFDEKNVPLLNRVNTPDMVTFGMDAPTLFSSDEPNNGVRGRVRFYNGTFTQTQNAYLAQQFGEATIPAYRGICYAVFEKCYLSNNDSVPPIAWIIRRTPNTLGLTGGKHNINGDANPVCAIFEILTNTVWGSGIPQAAIDVPSFIACANTVADEGLGISMLIDQPGTAESLSEEILRHIDGVIYVDPETGLHTMTLARDDYDLEDLPVIGPANIEADSFKFTRGSWDETKNTVKITYIDRAAKFTERMVQHQNLANITTRGGQVDADDFDFLGLSNATAANRVAARVMKTVSSPLARVECEVNLTVRDVRPGKVLNLTWPQLGIVSLPVRVVEVDYGTLDSGLLRIRAVEDIFSISGVSFIDPPESGWQNPLEANFPLARQSAFEVPFGMIAPEAGRYIAVSGSPASGPQRAYTIWQDPAGGSAFVEQEGSRIFTPSATLVSELAGNSPALITAGITLDNPISMSSVASVSQAEFDAGESLARIVSAAGEEIVAWRTITDNLDGTYTLNNILRGQYDTQPLTHAAGAIVYFISNGLGLVQNLPYAANGNVTLRATPFGTSNKLPLASATTMTVTLADRAARPYPVGNLRFNGTYLPSTISGPLTVAWSPRNRLTQSRVPYSQTGADVTAEAGTTYTVRFYGETGTLLRTFTNVATLTQDWTTETDDSGLVSVSPSADLQTISLLHFEGPNAGTNFGDDTGRTWVAENGTVTLTTAQSRFGGSSVSFPTTAGSRLRHAPTSNIVVGTGDFTVEFWFRLETLSVARTLLDTRPASTNGFFPNIYLGPDNSIRYNFNNADRITSAANAVTSASWNHAAVSRQAGSTRLFLNGNQIGSAYVDSSSISLPNIVLGNISFAANGAGLNGQMDEFRLVVGRAEYTANFTAPAAPFALPADPNARLIRDRLVHYYALDEGAGTANAADLEPNSPMALTVTGGTRATATIRTGGVRSTTFTSTGRAVSAVLPAEVNVANRVSFAAWVNFAGFSSSANVLFVTSDGLETEAGNVQAYLAINPTGRLVYLHEYGAGTNETVTASSMAPLAINTNYHVAVTRDSVASGGTNTVRFYVNGALVDTQTYTNARTGGTAAASRLVLGNGEPSGASTVSLNGRMQDALLTTDLLTDAEVAWLFNDGTGRSAADIIGVIRRLNDQVTVEVDTVRSGVTSRVPARWTVSRPGGV